MLNKPRNEKIFSRELFPLLSALSETDNLIAFQFRAKLPQGSDAKLEGLLRTHDLLLIADSQLPVHFGVMSYFKFPPYNAQMI